MFFQVRDAMPLDQSLKEIFDFIPKIDTIGRIQKNKHTIEYYRY